MSPSSTVLLREFLAKAMSSDHFGDLFQTLGILCDNHLRILMGIEREEREEFLQRYVPDRLTQLGLMDLTKMLDEFIIEHSWAVLSLRMIPRKKCGASRFENFLSQPGTSTKLVAHAMRFSTEKFDWLTTQIKLRIPWYLDIHCSIEEQNPKQIEALVQAISDDHPVFKQYEDAWPIPVIVKRVLGNCSTHDASDCATSTRSNFEPSLVHQIQCQPPSHQHRCPRLLNYYDYGGPSNISLKARTLLSFVNMDEELAPALYFLGVRDDSQFETVRRMRSNRKEQLLEQSAAEALQLTPFQLRVMSMIFEK